ncbi:MAG: DUF2442 domain-containing protein [Nitrococcus sp.]|nr:DUF2442 domain-containing protein [Nitrococcus sp.]
MYPAVKNVEAREDYTLSIEFDNGEQGVLDMKEYLDFGVFERLKDLQAFKMVKVAFDTVEWETGLDLDPEFVYQKCRILSQGVIHNK